MIDSILTGPEPLFAIDGHNGNAQPVGRRNRIGLVQDKELRMIGTLMYQAEDYRIAIDLIQSEKVNLDPLISQHFSFEDYAKAFAFIEEHQDKTMKVLIDL